MRRYHIEIYIPLNCDKAQAERRALQHFGSYSLNLYISKQEFKVKIWVMRDLSILFCVTALMQSQASINIIH